VVDGVGDDDEAAPSIRVAPPPPAPETHIVLVPLSERGAHLRYRISGRISFPGMLALSRAVSQLPSVVSATVSPESKDVVVLAAEVRNVESFLTDLAIIPGFAVRLEAPWSS
jgi:hypothetical protein